MRNNFRNISRSIVCGLVAVAAFALLAAAPPQQARVGPAPYRTLDQLSAAIRAGLFRNVTEVNVQGFNAAITTAIEDVHTLGGLIVVPDGASLEVVSASADDAAAGTGIQTITLVGLDGSGALQTETVSMNGTTAVNFAGTWDGANVFHAQTVGTGGVAAGLITLRDQGGLGTDYITIAAGENKAQKALYKVPVGRHAYVTSWTAGSSDAADLRIMIRATVDPTTELTIGPFLFQDSSLGRRRTYYATLDPPVFLPPLAVVKISGIAVKISGIALTGTGAATGSLRIIEGDANF